MEYEIFHNKEWVRRELRASLSENEINNLLERLRISPKKAGEVYQKLEKYLERK